MRIEAIIFVPFLFFGCKKYPEGGHHSHGVAGPYYISDLTVNGVDSFVTISSSPNFCLALTYQYQIEFSSTRHGETLKSQCANFATNSWKETNDNKQIVITFNYTPSAKTLYPIALNQDITVAWDIQRCTKNDLWIKTNLNGKEYYMKLTYFD
jgi:hypothetical protein